MAQNRHHYGLNNSEQLLCLIVVDPDRSTGLIPSRQEPPEFRQAPDTEPKNQSQHAYNLQDLLPALHKSAPPRLFTLPPNTAPALQEHYQKKQQMATSKLGDKQATYQRRN
jgi:hypothetical protein